MCTAARGEQSECCVRGFCCVATVPQQAVVTGFALCLHFVMVLLCHWNQLETSMLYSRRVFFACVECGICTTG